MPPLNKSAKVGRHAADNALNEIKHFTQRFVNRFTFQNLRLAERYDKQGCHILVHFRMRRTSKEYIALFHSMKAKSDSEGREAQIGMSCPLTQNRDTSERVDAFIVENRSKVDVRFSHWVNQEAVLINVVKLIDCPEKIIPSLVWVESVDSFFHRWRHAVYFAVSGLFIFVGTVVNRKIDVTEWPSFISWDSDSFSSDKYQHVGQMVQGAPEVLNGVSGDGAHWGGNILAIDECIDWLTGLRIALGPDFIWCSAKKRPHDDFEIVDVLLGPLGFYHQPSPLDSQKER